MTIYEKLDEARKIIRNSKVKKDGRNEFSKYDYFTPEQVESLVSEACDKVKAICITSLKKDEHGYYQELEFVDLEPKPPYEKMDSIKFELRTEMPAITATNAAQQMGGMDTYSERYVKMKAFQIKDNNLDFDAQDNRQTPAAKQATKGYNVNVITAQLQAAPTLTTMRKIWESLPEGAKTELFELKESLKAKLQRQTEIQEGNA